MISTGGEKTVSLGHYYYCCKEHLKCGQNQFGRTQNIESTKWEIQANEFKRKWLIKIKPIVTEKQFKKIKKIKINRWLE